jgi:hypothetical protein
VELSHAGLEVCEKFRDFRFDHLPVDHARRIDPFTVKNAEAPGPICVSLLDVNAVVHEATDGPHLTSRFGLFRLTAPGKMPSMTDLDDATIKLKRIRPKQCVFKGAIIGPNPR